MFLLVAIAATIAEVVNQLAVEIVDLRAADIGRALRAVDVLSKCSAGGGTG
jgi:hypothetical protein